MRNLELLGYATRCPACDFGLLQRVDIFLERFELALLIDLQDVAELRRQQFAGLPVPAAIAARADDVVAGIEHSFDVAGEILEIAKRRREHLVTDRREAAVGIAGG